MPVYTNVGGVRKELDGFYCNFDGVSKSVGKLYTNIGGTQKLLYEKTYVWAKYTALKGNVYNEYSASNIGVASSATVLYGDGVSRNIYDTDYPMTITGNLGTIPISDAVSTVDNTSAGVNPLNGKYVSIYNYDSSDGRCRQTVYKVTGVTYYSKFSGYYMFYDRSWACTGSKYLPQTFVEYVTSTDPSAYPSAGAISDSGSPTVYYYYERQ